MQRLGGRKETNVPREVTKEEREALRAYASPDVAYCECVGCAHARTVLALLDAYEALIEMRGPEAKGPEKPECPCFSCVAYRERTKGPSHVG